jgi:hypothetical protein
MTTIVVRILQQFQQIIGCILFERQSGLGDNASVKIVASKDIIKIREKCIKGEIPLDFFTSYFIFHILMFSWK